MFVAPLSLFAIYVLPNFRTLHSSYGWQSSLHSSGLEAVGLTYKKFFSKLNIVIFSPLHLHYNKNKLLNRIDRLRAKINKFLHPALFIRINVNQLTRNFISAYN